MAAEWTALFPADHLSENTAREVLVHGQVLAIFRTDDQLFALDGMCAHQGGPIAEGAVAAGCVTCPWHGWQYELETGIQTVNRKPLQKTFEIREREGQIEVRVEIDS